MILVLTTTGRKTGLRREIPLQYEEISGALCVASARGQKADWFRNIMANPEVFVRAGNRRFHGRAVPVVDPVQIANFLELRLQRHPKIVGAIMARAGLPKNPTRSQLEAYAVNRALVVIHPFSETPARIDLEG